MGVLNRPGGLNIDTVSNSLLTLDLYIFI